MEIMESEQIYFNVSANLFRGIEGVGGKLIITDKKLFFKSHAFNIQTGMTEISMETISKVKKINTLGIFPNGMLINTKDEFEYKFVLWDRVKIIDFIINQINA